MIDFELLIKNAQKFINILFPDIDTCRKIYHDPDLDSDNTVTKLMAMLSKKADSNIENFKFNDYINENDNAELFNYIKTFLPDKFKGTGEIIFNTLAIRILFNIHRNEVKISKDINLFANVINEEIGVFIDLVKSFTEHNNYFFYSHNFKIEKSFIGKYLTENIVIKSAEDAPVFALENVDYSVRIYQTLKPILVKALALIFNKKIEFSQFADAHTMKLEKYGCKNIFLYPINGSSYYISPYHKQLIPFGPKITIDDESYEMAYNLLAPYMAIIQNLDRDDYKNVSLEFFFDSLDKCGSAKITYSVIAIEALFNTNKEELTKTIVQRGLKILQNYYRSDYWEQIEIDLKTAYVVRSHYAHGEIRNHKKATYELSERISEYARIILLTFLLINPKIIKIRGKEKEKKYINEKLIDKSLFYPENNTEFCEILKDLPIYIKEFDKIVEIPKLSAGLNVFK
ncbi:MAG: hypothetical protein ACI37S_05735 [Candidatus Gastranaerophilaceae bacterium]